MQFAVDQRFGIVILAVARHDVAVYAAIRDVFVSQVVQHVLLCPEAHGLAHRAFAVKGVATRFFATLSCADGFL